MLLFHAPKSLNEVFLLYEDKTTENTFFLTFQTHVPLKVMFHTVLVPSFIISNKWYIYILLSVIKFVLKYFMIR